MRILTLRSRARWLSELHFLHFLGGIFGPEEGGGGRGVSNPCPNLLDLFFLQVDCPLKEFAAQAGWSCSQTPFYFQLSCTTSSFSTQCISTSHICPFLSLDNCLSSKWYISKTDQTTWILWNLYPHQILLLRTHKYYVDNSTLSF